MLGYVLFLCKCIWSTIKRLEWRFILLFSFLSKSTLQINEVNLFEKFRYRGLLSYFSSVILDGVDLDPTLNWEISLDF